MIKSDSPKSSPQGEKIQKVLARAGYGSRRELEQVIKQGRVTVNGRIAHLGDRIELKDRVELDRKKIRMDVLEKERLQVLLYNKPEKEICSRSDPEGRKTVFESLPHLKMGRWIAVGRLDFNTSGLLLFTNDGELANRLMHPSSGIDREYLVRIRGDVNDTMKAQLLKGILLGESVARFTDIVDVDGDSSGSNHWFYCVVMEGRNREVRRLWESQGVQVSRLKRVRFGNLFIPSHVRAGQWIELDDREIGELCVTASIEAPLKNKKLTREQKTIRERHQKKLRATSLRKNK